MKGLTRTLALGIGALTLTATLAGCITIAEDDKPTKPNSSSEKSEKTEKPEKKADAPKGDGSELAPGETTAGAGILPFSNHEDKTASFSHQIADISLAPDADVDAIVAEIPQAGGMDVYYITVDSNYVSGDNLEHSSFSNEFEPVDADGVELQSLSLIGWDNCESNSIPSPGDDPSTTISNCIAAVVVPGQPEPAGVAWAAYDSPYDSYEGSPAFILQG